MHGPLDYPTSPVEASPATAKPFEDLPPANGNADPKLPKVNADNRALPSVPTSSISPPVVLVEETELR